MHSIPLSLYIHFPWCVRKCPYCDFNSHALSGEVPEKEYMTALLLNLEQYLPLIENRAIRSIFMGGGTPSLFSAGALNDLLQEIKKRCNLIDDIEITLEANPSSVEKEKFKGYRESGINRLSLGIQSFNDHHLQLLGRVHNSKEALLAIDAAKQAGFTNFNIDLMFGLPEQSQAQGLADLHCALLQNPTHLSWYELTLEPNTYFWHHPPLLPDDEFTLDLQTHGQQLLQQQGFEQYEVSAYSKNKPCQHNLNYWEFGDYMAIGAGSHAKITDSQNQQITRWSHFRNPKQYMDINQGFVQTKQVIPLNQLAFEYMLNALRLKKGVLRSAFSHHTGLGADTIETQLQVAKQKGWLAQDDEYIRCTPVGYRFLNDVVSLFLL